MRRAIKGIPGVLGCLLLAAVGIVAYTVVQSWRLYDIEGSIHAEYHPLIPALDQYCENNRVAPKTLNDLVPEYVSRIPSLPKVSEIRYRSVPDEPRWRLTLPEDYISVVTGEVAESFKAYALEVTASEVREANANFRKECPWGFAWERHFWWIGENGAGGFYFIDTMESPCRVYYFDHKSSPLVFTDRSEFYPSDIGNHLSDAIELEAEGNAYDERMKAKVRNRKWWQVWIPRSWPPKQNTQGQSQR